MYNIKENKLTFFNCRSFEYCIFKDTIDYSPLKKLTKLKNL